MLSAGYVLTPPSQSLAVPPFSPRIILFLPTEVLDMTLDECDKLWPSSSEYEGRSRYSPLVTINRNWQAAVEERTRKHVRLNPDRGPRNRVGLSVDHQSNVDHWQEPSALTSVFQAQNQRFIQDVKAIRGTLAEWPDDLRVTDTTSFLDGHLIYEFLRV